MTKDSFLTAMEAKACPYCFSADLKINHRFCTSGVRRTFEPFAISQQRQRIDREERRKKAREEKIERKRQEEARVKDIREGKKYARDYERYGPDDIEEITDITFLYEMADAIIPSGQPPTPMEYDYFCYLLNTVWNRINELQSNK